MGDDQKPTDILDRFDSLLGKGESALLVLIIAVMVGLSSVQLFLRMAFDFGFEWADIMVRQMVLWLGFVGGALATHRGRHIAIDAARKLLPPRKGAALRAFTSLVAAGITTILVNAAVTFIKDEIDSETTVFGDVPSWPFQLIIPVAFVAMTFHFLVTSRNELLVALGKREPSPEGEEA